MESERILPELPTESLESCGSRNQAGGSLASNQRKRDNLPWRISLVCVRTADFQRTQPGADPAQCTAATSAVHPRSDGRVTGNRRSAMLRVVTAERLQGVRRQPDCARRLPVWSQIRRLRSGAMRRVQSSAAEYGRMSGNGRIREERPNARGTAECGQMQRERSDKRSGTGDCDELIGMGIISRENSEIEASPARTPNGIVEIMRFTKSGRREFSIKST